jgi:filamentous hemagglutinin family protein
MTRAVDSIHKKAVFKRLLALVFSVVCWGLNSTDTAAQTPAPTQAISANQLPTGGTVSAGQAVISQSANTMSIKQYSQRAIIDWNSFNIGANAQVNIQQPNAQAAVLNRVSDVNPTQILGKLTSNGQVALVNSEGVYVGKSATVDVGSIVATTHQADANAFMNGGMNFTRSGSTGSVINDGKIRAAYGGYIALLAPEVQNNGLVLAKLGTVALAAGEAFELQFDTGGGLRGIQVSAATIDVLVQNSKAVKAPGGLIIMSAQALNKLQTGVVNNTGVIEAGRLVNKNGRIVLEASTSVSNTGSVKADLGGEVQIQAPVVTNSGLISATGGQINVQSDRFVQTSTGSMDSSGQLAFVKSGAIYIEPAGYINIQATTSISIEGSVNSQGITDSAANYALGLQLANTVGGSLLLQAGQSIEINTAVLDASGPGGAGVIHMQAGSGATSGLFKNPAPNPQAPPVPGSIAIMGVSLIRTSSSKGKGGLVELEADSISLDTGVKIDANGGVGGGSVLIGGDWQGSGSVYQATSVSMASGATLDASATGNGNGGKVVLWSEVGNTNSITKVSGTISAKGGLNGGNGGQVETSGHQLLLGDQISISTRAPQGADGSWLLDPSDLYIQDTSWDGSNYGISGTTFTAQTPNPSAPILASDSSSVDTRGSGYASGNSVLRTDTLINALLAGNVQVIATGLIYVNGWTSRPVYPTTAYINTTSSNKLSLQAGVSIVLGSAPVYMPNGTLELLAGTSITQSAGAPIYLIL